MFNNKDLERYSRQIVLKKVGILGQKKIYNSKVLVVGCGGLGTPVIDLLSRAGVGEIGMMDHDKVSMSNLHRQVIFTSDDVGKYKVSILKKKISKINKNVKVKIYRDKAEDKNLGKILKLYDVIVDGTDKNVIPPTVNFSPSMMPSSGSVINVKCDPLNSGDDLTATIPEPIVDVVIISLGIIKIPTAAFPLFWLLKKCLLSGLK